MPRAILPSYLSDMMRSNDNKASEITRMKGKMVEIEAALKEQRKSSGKLRENQEKKLYELASLDEEIAQTVESFRWKQLRLVNEKVSLERKLNTQSIFHVM